MIHSYEISRRAKRDLDEIWTYTAESWSVDQANIYFEQIISTIDRLCQNPMLSKDLGYAKHGYRAALVKSHLIVFYIDDAAIKITRILHQSMDIERRINE